MLIAIDIGNTNISTGVYEGEDLVHTFRTGTDRNKTYDLYSSVFTENLKSSNMEFNEINSAIISCVVPELSDTIEAVINQLFGIKPVFVSSNINTGLEILYKNPEELGADRIANSVAAYSEIKGASVVVDVGTATTFDCVTSDGKYLGGVICPGLKISSDALFSTTSLLPRVELEKPRNTIGKSTSESLQSGIVNGYRALVDGLIVDIKDSMSEVPTVVATGGLSGIIAKESNMIDYVDEFLTIKGLKYLYDLNG